MPLAMQLCRCAARGGLHGVGVPVLGLGGDRQPGPALPEDWRVGLAGGLGFA